MAFFNPQPVNSNGPVASLVGKVCAPNQIARLHRIMATNGNATVRYIQIFDATALPSNGAVPLITFPLQAVGTSGSSTQPPIDLGVYGRIFVNGIVIANSTTEATLTIGSADSFFDLLVS